MRTGRFYDIAADVLEERPLPDHNLAPPAAAAKRQLESVLTEMAGDAFGREPPPGGDPASRPPPAHGPSAVTGMTPTPSGRW